MVARLRHGALALTLGLSLILGSLILGIIGLGSSASAEGPSLVSGASTPPASAAVFYGYVFADATGALPDRVRALGPTGAVCGSAEVARVSDFAGFYAVSVVSSEIKRGCPSAGGVVQFALLSGRLQDGAWAEEIGTFDASGTPRLVALSPARASLPGWLGAPGNVDGGSLLRWDGETVPLASALATLTFPTGAVYRLDARAIFVEVTSAVSAEIEPGELLLVRFR